MSMPKPENNSLRVRLFAAVTAAAVLVCAIIYAVLRLASADNAAAQILTDGEVFAVIDLNDYTDGKSTTITVPSEYSGGENVIEVSGGRIRVISASCPDKVCISQGERGIGCDNSAPVTCLPNRLTIVTDDGGRSADAAAGIN